MLTDAHWMRLEPLIEACRPKGKTPPQNLRRTLSAIVWRHQNGAKWRAIPAELGPWSRAAQTFSRWAHLGVWERLLGLAQERGVQLGMTLASRPEEFHLRPLTERCGSLSAHTAPTKQPVGIRTGMSNGFVAAKVSSCCQLDVDDNRLAQPLCSSRMTSLPRSYGLVRPCAPHWYARLVVVATWTSPLTSERQVPAVPHESPDQTRASSTPVAIRPVPRCPAD